MDKGKQPEEPESFQTPSFGEIFTVEPISQVPPTPPTSPINPTEPPPEHEPSIFESLYSEASGGEERYAHSPPEGGMPEMSSDPPPQDMPTPGDDVHASGSGEGVFASAADQYYGSYNPANAFLPHQPRWDLTQGSRFTNVAACEDYLSFGLPPAERIFQRNRPSTELDSDYHQSLANTVSAGQEIVREWRYMKGEWNRFEAERHAFHGEKKRLHHETGSLRWKIVTMEKAAAASAEEHKKARADYLAACSKSNAMLEAAREASRRADEKFQHSVKANAELHATIDAQKLELDRLKTELAARDSRIAGLEADVTARDSQIAGLEADKTSLTEEAAATSSILENFYDDQRWILEKGVPEVRSFCVVYLGESLLVFYTKRFLCYRLLSAYVAEKSLLRLSLNC